MMTTTTTTTTTAQETQYPPVGLPPSYSPPSSTSPPAQPTQTSTISGQENGIAPAPSNNDNNNHNGAQPEISYSEKIEREQQAQLDAASPHAQPQPQTEPTPVQPMTATHAGLPPGANPLDYPVAISDIREDPCAVDCPHCHQRVMTSTENTTGNNAIGWGVALCCLTGLLCAWIPFVMSSCQDKRHLCTGCGQPIVTVSTSGRVMQHPVKPPPVVLRPAPPVQGQQPANA